jgi:hypothetical protein
MVRAEDRREKGDITNSKVVFQLTDAEKVLKLSRGSYQRINKARGAVR